MASRVFPDAVGPEITITGEEARPCLLGSLEALPRGSLGDAPWCTSCISSLGNPCCVNHRVSWG